MFGIFYLQQSIGFQGEDPTTDIRSGGFLSVECLEHFATFYTDGVKQSARPSTSVPPPTRPPARPPIRATVYESTRPWAIHVIVLRVIVAFTRCTTGPFSRRNIL